MISIAVIDYGMGNLHSISKALEHASTDSKVVVTADPKIVMAADRVVFPGVGAIRDCMVELKRTLLLDTVIEASQQKPFLGICLGMQSLLDHSDENNGIDCLGVIAGQVRHFDKQQALSEQRKIPHMGWNTVKQRKHPLWNKISDESRFYFVHSYYVVPDNDACIAGITPYGVEFCAALVADNLFAVQFHPEKSQSAGLQLLNNFIHWNI